ncbi:tetratricopeptide repeat protein [Leptolyngbya ohadii]|uniref:tetratricopeptide repeat protein n=1 Tax=Leptolyngbya ohadii TaxID=1962290 RepID=UPI000B59FCD8|nr:tetratricopeptide repeat protein [Leptolyngbya ohadii]
MSDVNLRLQPYELHYNLGYVLQEQGRWEQAAVHYRKAIWLGKQSGQPKRCANAHHNLGVILAQQERWLAAIYHYRRAIALQHENSRTDSQENLLFYCNLGTALLQQGEPEAAIAVFRQALQQGIQQEIQQSEQAALVWANSYHRLYHHYGQALQQQGCLTEAIEAYRQSLAIDPEKAEVYYNLGRAFQQQGNWVEAGNCFQQAVDHDADLTVARADLAFVWLKLGQFDRAMQGFRQAIAPNAAFVAAYCDWILGQQEHRLAETDEFSQARIGCAELLTALLQINFQASQSDCPDHLPDVSPDVLPGDLSDRKDHLAHLRLLLVRVLSHWANVLTDYGGEHQLRAAEQLYHHALQLQPQQMELYHRLGSCLQRQNRGTAAIGIYRLALAIAPEDAVIQPVIQAELEQLSGNWQTGQRDGQVAKGVSCEGLNCRPCLQKMTHWFEPMRLEEGIYQLTNQLTNRLKNVEGDRLESGLNDRIQEGSDRQNTVICQNTVIPDGRVWVAPQTNAWQSCRTVAVFSAEGEILPQLSRSYPDRLPVCQHREVMFNGLPEVFPEPLLLKGRVAVLSSLSGSVYFHWMIDLLPRLRILQRQFNLQDIDYFVVNSNQRSFQQETLRVFGIHSDRIIESDRHPYVQAEQLIVPEFASDLGWAQSWAIDFLRRKLLSKLSDHSLELNSSESTHQSTHNHPPLIYLSRSDARYRRLLNEDEVFNLLQPYGFVSLTLDSLSVSQQADLFAHARVIVAPHGSSLTNLVFCSPGTSVIELTSPHYRRHYFWRISRLLNLTHYVIFGEVFSCHFLRQLMYPNPLLEDIWVNSDRLHQVIQKVFVQQGFAQCSSAPI